MKMDTWVLQEQKQKQREKEYEKKRDAKARDRQMYYMRHTRDYEVLELPVGASRAEVKAAYRKLAKVGSIWTLCSMFLLRCYSSWCSTVLVRVSRCELFSLLEGTGAPEHISA